MTIRENIEYLKLITNKEIYYEQDTKFYYIVEDGIRINIYQDIFQSPYEVENSSRFSIIEDNTGRWVRDNETGIEYSSKIGLGLIDTSIELVNLWKSQSR